MLDLIGKLGVFSLFIAIIIFICPLLSYLELRKIRRKLEDIDNDIHYGILHNPKPDNPYNNYFKQ